MRKHWPLLIALLLAALFKGALLAADLVPFNSDEAVVALMARHILQGARPVFFYGQAYLGSLDAWLAAGVMAVIGEKVLAIRLVQSVLWLGTIASAWFLSLRIYNSRVAAVTTVALLAVSIFLTTLYTTASLGGYGEVFLAGNLLLLWTLRLRERGALWEWALWGLLAGVVFWGFGLIGVYIAPAGLALVWPRLRAQDWRWLLPRVALLGGGFLIGASPWWWFTLQNGLATLAELGGSHIAGESPGPLASIGRRLLALVLFGPTAFLGLRTTWSVDLLLRPLSPIAVVLGLGTLFYALRQQWQQRAGGADVFPAKTGRGLVLGVMLTNVLGFVLTSFGNDPSGRYFLPIAVLLPVLAGELIDVLGMQRRWIGWAALGLWLAFNLGSNLEVALAYPDEGPGFTTQFDVVAQVDKRYDDELIDFLLAEGETRGYGNYWVTYPIAFLSGEQLQYSARLPYHHNFAYTERDDRYPPYIEAVAEAERVAYITTNHPALDDYLRQGLAGLGVRWAERTIGDYTVFYDLSRVVRPVELGLGEDFGGYDDP